MSVVNLRIQKASYEALVGLAADADSAARDVELPHRAIELLRIRVSQINGCAFCLRTHTRDAIKFGETTDRLATLSVWRETRYFDAVERAVLEIAEHVTLREQLHSALPTETTTNLSDAQIAAASWLAVIMNALNRVAIVSRYDVGPAQRL